MEEPYFTTPHPSPRQSLTLLKQLFSKLRITRITCWGCHLGSWTSNFRVSDLVSLGWCLRRRISKTTLTLMFQGPHVENHILLGWCLSVQLRSVIQSCSTLCNRMDCSMSGFPVHHQLPELTQTHVLVSKITFYMCLKNKQSRELAPSIEKSTFKKVDDEASLVAQW